VRAPSKIQLLGIAAYLAITLSGCGGGVPESAPKPTDFSLTVSSSGSGTVSSTPAGINCGTTCSASFAAGSSVTLTATPAAGDSFSGWSGACSGAGKCTVVLNADTAVGAAFSAPGTVTVSAVGPGTGTVTSNPAGINCGQSCSGTFPSGTSVTLTATAAANSSFAGWSGACTGTAACFAYRISRRPHDGPLSRVSACRPADRRRGAPAPASPRRSDRRRPRPARDRACR